MVRASWTLVCLLHALKCDRSMAVPGVGSVMACPVWLPCSVPQTRKFKFITATATVRIYAFIQWKATVVHSSDSWGHTLRCHHTEPFTSCVLCYDTALKAHEERKGGGGGGLRYEFGDFQELGLYCFLGQGEHVHMPFFCFVDFCLTLTYEYIYYIYITLNIMFLVNCNQITF